ncbi:TPA: hypothetical protein ACH3X1_012425 [Trebouxia sp. C0004]
MSAWNTYCRMCDVRAIKYSSVLCVGCANSEWLYPFDVAHHPLAHVMAACLSKLAMVDGFALDQTAAKDSWQHYLGDFLHGHLGQQQLFHKFNIASGVERAKHQHVVEYFADVQHTSLMLYRTMQPDYKPAEYLSVVKCASNKRLISRFRTGCHDLRIDTGRWADGVHLDRTGCV